jgi:hypothetical protein
MTAEKIELLVAIVLLLNILAAILAEPVKRK